MAQSVYSSWSLDPCQLSSWVESPHFQPSVACQKLPSVINPRSISLGFAIRRGSEGRKAMASYAGIRRGPGSLSMAKGLVAEEEETKHSLEKNTWLHKDSGDLELSELTAISPLDGRYASKVKELRPILSEYGLIRYRVIVEVQWLLKLSQIPEISEVSNFSNETKLYLEDIVRKFNIEDALEVKRVENVTNHDVKAVEYVLKKRFEAHPELTKVLEFIHFSCTSEDINNLAHSLMLREALDLVILPSMDQLIDAIRNLAHKYAHIPMLSRTHGQPASPTTLGKEMANFCFRLSEQRRKVAEVRLLGKMAGAVGNYNAHLVAYPAVPWQKVAEEFVTSLGIVQSSGFKQHLQSTQTVLRAFAWKVEKLSSMALNVSCTSSLLISKTLSSHSTRENSPQSSLSWSSSLPSLQLSINKSHCNFDRQALIVVQAAWTRRSKSEAAKSPRKKSWKQRTDMYMRPFLLDVFISKKYIHAKVMHRVTSKVVSVATTNARDLRYTLPSLTDLDACRTIGKLIAERSKEADVYAVSYEPRKGERVEGKLGVILDTIKENDIAFV